MARYILIDNTSGYVWGDSADLGGAIFSGTPEEYAQALDESLGVFGRQYVMRSNDPHNKTGYHVYRADEAVPVVWDGQEAVMDSCRYEGFIDVVSPE